MIDGCPLALKIFLFRFMKHRLSVRFMQRLVLVTAVGEGAGDTYGTQGIQAIGILNDFPLQRFHFGRNPRPLETHGLEDLANMGDNFFRNGILGQELAGGFRTCRLIPLMEFPVGHIVEERRQLDDKQIGPLFPPQFFCQPPDAKDVPPVMPRPFPVKTPPNLPGDGAKYLLTPLSF